MFKRFFFLFLAFTVSLSGLSVLFSDTVNAATPYDDVITLTSTLELSNTTASCEENVISDLQLNWTRLFDPTAIDPFGQSSVEFNGVTYGLFATPGSPYMSLQQNRDSWAEAESWSVVQNDNYQGFNKRIEITWSTEPGTSLTFYNNDRLQAVGTNVYQSIVTLENFGSGCGIRMETRQMLPGGGFGALVQYSPGRQMLLANWNIIYPDGYEGENPPDSVELGTIFRPVVGYAVKTDNTFEGLYYGDLDICIPVGLDEITGCVQPKLYWTAYEPDGTTEIKSQFSDLYQPFNYRFLAYDTYYVDVRFAHPGPPFAPFHSSIEIQTVRFTINANGTFVAGGTESNNCNVDGGIYVCEEASPLEDCSVYAGVFPYGIGGGEFPDIIGGAICIATNAGILLRNTLVDLFMPNTQQLGARVIAFGEFFQSQLGFVYTAFSMLTSWIATLVSVEEICDINLGGTFFSAPIEIDFCQFEEASPTVYTVAMTTTRLFIAAGFVFIAYRRMIEIIQGLGR